MIEIVGILIAAGDGVDAGADHVGARMADARRIATTAGTTAGDGEDAAAMTFGDEKGLVA